MRLAAVTKIKHGQIWEALQKLGWNQADLARACNIGPTLIGDIVNLKRRPTQGQVKKIEDVFLLHGLKVDVVSQWPELFKLKKNRMDTYREVEGKRLIEFSATLGIEVKETLEVIFRKLRPIEIEMLINHHVHGESISDIGKRHGMSSSRANQIKQSLGPKMAELRRRINADGIELEMYMQEDVYPVEDAPQARYDAYCLLVEQVGETPISFKEFNQNERIV